MTTGFDLLHPVGPPREPATDTVPDAWPIIASPADGSPPHKRRSITVSSINTEIEESSTSDSQD